MGEIDVERISIERRFHLSAELVVGCLFQRLPWSLSYGTNSLRHIVRNNFTSPSATLQGGKNGSFPKITHHLLDVLGKPEEKWWARWEEAAKGIGIGKRDAEGCNVGLERLEEMIGGLEEESWDKELLTDMLMPMFYFGTRAEVVY